nr:hypothetical protein [Crenothrix polyspora]
MKKLLIGILLLVSLQTHAQCTKAKFSANVQASYYDGIWGNIPRIPESSKLTSKVKFGNNDYALIKFYLNGRFIDGNVSRMDAATCNIDDFIPTSEQESVMNTQLISQVSDKIMEALENEKEYERHIKVLGTEKLIEGGFKDQKK